MHSSKNKVIDMSSKQNKNFEIVQYNFEVFVFVMIIYYTLYFSCSFYISRAYLKSFLQDVRHNLWGFDQDDVAVANYVSQIQKKHTAK